MQRKRRARANAVPRAPRTRRTLDDAAKRRAKLLIDLDDYQPSEIARDISAKVLRDVGKSSVSAVLRGYHRSVGKLEPLILWALRERAQNIGGPGIEYEITYDYLGWPENETAPPEREV